MPFSLVLLAAGCAWFSDADRAAVVDADGDGFAAQAFGGTDCDDADAAVGEAALAVHPDADGDGLGDPDQSTYACAPSGRLVEDATDCDDADAGVGGMTDWSPDADGDGYGDDAQAALSCGGAGLVTLGGDCDDARDDVHPGAVEDCLSGLDANCDQKTGGSACTTAGLAPWVTGTEDGSGSEQAFAERLLGGVDVDGDGVPDVVAGMPYGYAVSAYSGVDLAAGAPLELDDAVLTVEGFHYRMGAALAAGDATRDGTPDLLIGCPGSDDPPTAGSEVLVVALPATGTISRHTGEIQGEPVNGGFGFALAWTDHLQNAPALIVGAPIEADAGGYAYALDMTDYLNVDQGVWNLDYGRLGGVTSHGDGYGLGWDAVWLYGADRTGSPVAAVAAPQAVVGPDNPGAVYLWEPDANGGMDTVGLDDATVLVGEADYDGFGFSMSAGDYDGDGLDDLAVGAITAEGQTSASGVVYVFSAPGPWAGMVSAADADVLFLGEARNGPEAETQEILGVAVAFVGDMNGDGTTELAMGAPNAQGLAGEVNAGAVYVAPGELAPRAYNVQEVAWARYGDRAGLETGASLSAAGDLDEDGRADLAVGMTGYTDAHGDITGAFTVWFGAQL